MQFSKCLYRKFQYKGTRYVVIYVYEQTNQLRELAISNELDEPSKSKTSAAGSVQLLCPAGFLFNRTKVTIISLHGNRLRNN